MQSKRVAQLRKKQLVLAAMAALGLTSMSAYSADPEVEALKQEVQEQRKLIDQLLANQQAGGNRVAANPPAAAKSPETNEATVPAPPSDTIVKFYGMADVGVVNENTGYGHKTRVDGGGGWSASRFGVQVNRSMGNGLKAVAVAEAGLQYDTGSVGNSTPALGINDTAGSSSGQNGTGPEIFARQIFAGLTGDFGRISIGRQYTASYIAVAAIGAPKGDGLLGSNAGSFSPLIGGMPTRVNSSLIYITPKVAGAYGMLTVTPGSENNTSGNVLTAAGATTTTNSKAGRGFDLGVIYSAGPFNAAVTGWDLYNTSWVTTGETGLAKKTGIQLAANYDLQVLKVYGSFVDGKIAGGNYQNVTKALSSATVIGLGVLIPFGKSTIDISAIHLNDKSQLNRDGTMMGFGYWYTLYPNTVLYAAWGRQQNNHNASYGLADGADTVGTISKAGVSPSGFQGGMNFAF